MKHQVTFHVKTWYLHTQKHVPLTCKKNHCCYSYIINPNFIQVVPKLLWKVKWFGISLVLYMINRILQCHDCLKIWNFASNLKERFHISPIHGHNTVQHHPFRFHRHVILTIIHHNAVVFQQKVDVCVKPWLASFTQ